jgi:uncharacterized membrane protein YtjA (UPF0391 family)
MCLFIALVAAIFGFGIVSTDSWFAAKSFSFIFVILAVASFTVGGIYYRFRASWDR